MVYYFQTFLLKLKATFKCIVKKLQDPSTVQQITLRSLTLLADSIKEVKHSRMPYENVCRPQKMTPEFFSLPISPLQSLLLIFHGVIIIWI